MVAATNQSVLPTIRVLDILISGPQNKLGGMMSNFENSFPGYTQAVLPDYEELIGTENWTIEDWQTEFRRSRQRLISFLDARDPYVTLARSAIRLFTEPAQANVEVRRLEQAEVEMIQSLLLCSAASVRSVPTSPANFVRFWPLMSKHLHAFVRMQASAEETAEMMISRRTRTQTLYYRNLFTRANCERVLDGILTKIDRQSRAALGYELSALFHAMSRVLDLILDRLEQFRRHVMILLNSDSRPEILEVVDFFCSAYPLASRVWRARMDCFTDVDQLRDAGFQLSELSYPWVFTLSRDTLEREFEPPIVEVLYSLSHQKGDLSTAEPDHIYLNNPIWQKPYIRLESGDLFAPLAQLAFSFPFVIVERLMAGHADLKRAYEDARSKYLT